MQRYGITIPFDGLPLAAQRDLVAELPDLGYTDAWSYEVDGADAFTPLVLASVWAPALRLGTAIAPVFTRGPATLAQCAASLAAAAPGRVAVGIGTSSDVIVERWNGARFERPLARVRDTARFLRAALAGAKVTERYETFAVDGFRLGLVPDPPPRLLIAALRPQMLRLAGRESDRAFHQWLGRGERLAPMWEAWAAGDRRGALAALDDDLVDELVVHGAPEACRERLAQYAEAGVQTPILALMPVGGDVGATVRALAPAAG